MERSAYRHEPGGFTLLEVLLSMALLGLLMLSLSLLLRGQVAALSQQLRLARDEVKLARVMNVLEQDVQSSFAAGQLQDGSSIRYLLIGVSSGTVSTDVDLWNWHLFTIYQPQLRAVEYRVVTLGDQTRLMRGVYLLSADGSFIPTLTPRPVADVEGFSLYRTDRIDGTGQWNPLPVLTSALQNDTPFIGAKVSLAGPRPGAVREMDLVLPTRGSTAGLETSDWLARLTGFVNWLQSPFH